MHFWQRLGNIISEPIAYLFKLPVTVIACVDASLLYVLAAAAF
jgi:hypothetical protein